MFSWEKNSMDRQFPAVDRPHMNVARKYYTMERRNDCW